jgi:hypothetical protein
MATTYYLSPVSLLIQYFTNLGLLAPGALINTYVAGSVNTPATTYTDSTGIVANANPMSASSAARPASAAGAPVEFWVPGGTVIKLVVTDSTGANQLVYLDNLPALNDLTNATNSLQSLLASASNINVSGSGPVAGADLVANAVKSYDVIADVRAANAPALVTGQTLNIELQGGSAINDGLGGFFYWSPTSTATDDGRTVLKPNSVATASQGRWLRYYPLGVPQIIMKVSPQQVASQTTLQNDTVLTANLAAGAFYLVQVRLQLLGIGGTGQGWKFGLNYAGSIAGDGAGGGVSSSNGTAAASYAVAANGPSALTGAAAGSTNPDVVNMDFIIQTTLAGVLTVQFAQNSSSANAIQMNSGSSLIITRIG